MGRSEIPFFYSQAPKLKAKTPQTLKQLENNLKHMCTPIHTEQSGLGLMCSGAKPSSAVPVTGVKRPLLVPTHPGFW